jgi:diguanylate cyclase (GGDEF)-like protein
MMLASEARRVLLAAGSKASESLRELFNEEPLNAWKILEADSFARARFVLQHDPCDVLVVNEDLLASEGGQGLGWLAWNQETPIVYLAGSSSEMLRKAYEQGATICLPRQMVLEQPMLLVTAIEHARQAANLRQEQRVTKERLHETRQHVDRLINMIWRTTPRQAEVHWFSQRYMMERLTEELSRAERHQIPLTLALGEVQPAAAEEMELANLMPDWTMNTIAGGKRRSDVAGQYGPDGFMLLMVHTPIKGGLLCCRRLQKAIEHPQEPLPGPHANLHAYFGISGTLDGKTSAAGLLRLAEQNLDAARREAKERLVVK